MTMTIYKHRIIARIQLEATSPVAVGSGEKDIITDAPVARDCNGLPYIPGTSLMGIIRHSLQPEVANKLLGYQDTKDRSKGEGSKVIISDALMVGADGKALDGLQDKEQDEFLQHFQVLPVRQHVRITDKGTAAKAAKFDEQVVYAGTRFVFELEMLSEDGNDERMQEMLQIISSPTFRIGSGTRCGFGSMKVVSMLYKAYDLEKKEDLQAYLQKTSCLADNFAEAREITPSAALQEGWTKYTLHLSPLDFFLFSSGIGDEEADMTPVNEQRIAWENGKPSFTKACALIPATSVKGAMAHRIAYHWNKINSYYVEDGSAKAADQNSATIHFFGTATDEAAIGNVIFSDVMLENTSTKVLPHIKIDKFTGGVMDGALFQEKATLGKGRSICETIYVRSDVLQDEKMRDAFNHTVQDICNGMLPLGGGTNRGNGIFTGSFEVEEK